MSQNKVVSVRVNDNTLNTLNRFASRLGRTASDTGALLIEEGLRRNEYGFIDFRDSTVGRQAYVLGTSLAVWEVVMIARDYKMNLRKTAKHLEWPEHYVQAALNYAATFSEDIASAIEENQLFGFDKISRALPQAKEFVATK